MEKYKQLEANSYVHKGLIDLLHCGYFILQDEVVLWRVNNEYNLYDSVNIQADTLQTISFS